MPDPDPLNDPLFAEHAGRVRQALIDLIAAVPSSTEPESSVPQQRALAIGQAAGNRAALLSAAMSLPPGPLGWLALLPELVAVWRLQAQMVADIAGAYGQRAALSQAAMIHCLFRHATAQALRDTAVRAGERWLLGRAQRKALESVAGRVGRAIGQRNLGRSVARWLPLVGAGAAAFYARHDTLQVAAAAIELFDASARGEVQAQ